MNRLNYQSGVALWTDHNRRRIYVISDLTNNRWATHLQQRANTNEKNITFFKLERTSCIAHEQTQVYDKNLKRKNETSYRVTNNY